MESVSYVCTLSDELQEKARKELNEDPERRSDDIDAIRKWLHESDMHFKKDDKFILRFLRVCKFDLKKTKNRIRSFYNLRNSTPEWFSNRDPLRPEIEEILDLGIIVPLPGYDREGRRVVLVHYAVCDPNRHKIEDLMIIEQLLADLIIEDEQTQICGISALLNVGGATFSHFRMWNLGTIRKQINVWQKGNPVRLKILNFINESGFYVYLFNTFKYFFQEKIRKRIHFYGKGLESLDATIPLEMLPEEYGGTAGKLQDIIDFWKKEVISRRQQILNDEVNAITFQ